MSPLCFLSSCARVTETIPQRYLSHHFHPERMRWCLHGGFIPGDRAPLVAHPLTAHSLMRIISGVLLVNNITESSKIGIFGWVLCLSHPLE